MTDEIKPALTPEEWRRWENGESVVRGVVGDGGVPDDPVVGMGIEISREDAEDTYDPDMPGDEHMYYGAGIGIDAGDSTPAPVLESDLPALVALANAALPDDSPYKITHADVRRCLDVAAGIEVEYAAGHQLQRFATAALIGEWRTLAAKLAALLPPE